MISEIEIFVMVYRVIGYMSWLLKGVYYYWIN